MAINVEVNYFNGADYEVLNFQNGILEPYSLTYVGTGEQLDLHYITTQKLAKTTQYPLFCIIDQNYSYICSGFFDKQQGPNAWGGELQGIWADHIFISSSNYYNLRIRTYNIQVNGENNKKWIILIQACYQTSIEKSNSGAIAITEEKNYFFNTNGKQYNMLICFTDVY